MVNEVDYEKLNVGIRKTVKWLRKHGFQTCDSGDGKTADFGCDRGCPYVVSEVEPNMLTVESNRLCDMLTARGIEVLSMTMEGRSPTIHASYSPTDRHAFVDIMFLEDSMLTPVMLGEVDDA